jgi:HK97 family phage major capsid protein
MEANEKALVDAINAEVGKKLDAVKEASQKENESLKAELKAASDNISAVKNEVNEELIKIKGLVEKPAVKEFKSFDAALKDAFAEKAKDIKSIVDAKGRQTAPLFIEVKAAVTMGEDNTIGAGTTQYTLTQNTGIISPILHRTEKYLAAVSVGSIGNDRALWIEETDEQGTPIFIGEGDGKTKLSVLYVEKTATVKKIAVYGKVTTEMLADLPQLISYIQTNLAKRLSLKIEDQLFAGNNTGDNLNGAITMATAFAAGSAAGTIAMANEFDVLNAIATQVELAYGTANAVFVHPSTLQAMKAIKSTTGEVQYKDYMDIMGSGDMVVAGMKVYSTPAVTAGEFIGGDMKALHVLFREQINIQIGLDGNDFTNNLKTMIVESRLVQFASANETPLLIKGDFATAIAALNLGA